ncbi:MAG: hypothetical protein AAF611_10880 [Bacteroidota bacterium]
MKNNYFFSILSLLIFTLYACEPQLAPEMVIEKSLEEAHGGKAAWETPKRLVYEKTTKLYDSLGNVVRIKKQTFYNILQPRFTSTAIWVEDNVEKRIMYDGKETFVFENDKPIKDASAVKAAYKEIMAAQYVLWQPYKLYSDKATLESQGIVQLEDKTSAYRVQVTYPNSDVIWWYYFDINTFVLKENLIQHNETTYSQIVNIEQEENTGLRLHKYRKSFKVDVVKDHKYLRAEYWYKIISLE